MPAVAALVMEPAGGDVPTGFVASGCACSCSCCRLNDTPDASGPRSFRESGVLLGPHVRI